jgi:hypothetical protein
VGALTAWFHQRDGDTGALAADCHVYARPGIPLGSQETAAAQCLQHSQAARPAPLAGGAEQQAHGHAAQQTQGLLDSLQAGRQCRELAAVLELEAAGQAAGAAAADGGGPSAATGGRRRPVGRAAAELNSPFTGEEVWVQVRRMRRAGAAPGLDGLGACLLKNAYYEWVEDSQGRPQRAPLLAEAIAQLFTLIAHTRFPPKWNEQPLTPVLKGKGSASDPCNYLPIQSQCALAKLFSMTLHARLAAFAEGQGLRAQGQAGFRHKRRASDNIFVLRHLYVCFVDFEKAYDDSVHRDALMRFLASVGVHGHTLATLCDMHWHVRARPKVRGRLGPAFETTCCVRQGDPLSPLLFGMCTDRIEAHLARHVSGVGAHLAGLATPLQVLLYVCR